MIETNQESAQRLTETLFALGLQERLALVVQALGERVVFTTSFGLEDQAITHVIATANLPIAIVTLDTGRLFEETYDVWAQTQARYGIAIEVFSPAAPALEGLIRHDGVNGFRESVEARQRCCGVRKVVPLERALAGASGWITGLRSGQSGNRADTPLIAWDRERELFKVSPLADWSRDRVAAAISAYDIPYNLLHDRGFASIGCAPCTRATRVGEHERAGRWWWEDEDKKECGLHERLRPGRAAVATDSVQPA